MSREGCVKVTASEGRCCAKVQDDGSIGITAIFSLRAAEAQAVTASQSVYMLQVITQRAAPDSRAWPFCTRGRAQCRVMVVPGKK